MLLKSMTLRGGKHERTASVVINHANSGRFNSRRTVDEETWGNERTQIKRADVSNDPKRHFICISLLYRRLCSFELGLSISLALLTGRHFMLLRNMSLIGRV